KAADSPLFRKADVGPPVSLTSGGGLLHRFGATPQQQLQEDSSAPIGRGPRPPTAIAHVASDGRESSSIGNDSGWSFERVGKDLRTGAHIGASGAFHTAGNIIHLINLLNDGLTRSTGVGTMSEETDWKPLERWLYRTGEEIAPAPEDLPNALSDKI